MAGLLGGFGSRGARRLPSVGVGSVQTSESSGVWIIGMRYKIINAETTEQVATGYTEEKMEVGAKSTSVLGVSQVPAGRRVARYDGAAAGAEVGLGNRQQVQVERPAPNGRRRRRAAGVAVFGQREPGMADISTLGKYEIRHEIGRGAMGVVYEGYDPMIKRIVALKTIRADQLAGAESARTSSRGSAARRRRPDGSTIPNIVSIYEFGEDAGTWFIAMEFVEGRELKQCFEANERFTTADIVRIMSQVLDALDYSHRQGVIHRDIKPANIFLLPGGVVKVADFGIAHIETSNLTQVGAVMGTPSYMSPEQIMGLPVDGRSDLFSAGVILYQFLTGERPFAGSATTTMQKVLKEDPLPPSSLNVQAPAGMDAVVRKALAKRPEDRFQTAREFADALARGRAAACRVVDRRADAGRRRRRDTGHGGCADVLPQPTAAAAPPAPAAVPVANRKEIADRCGRASIDRRRRRGDRCASRGTSRSGRRHAPAATTQSQSAPAPSQPTPPCDAGRSQPRRSPRPHRARC